MKLKTLKKYLLTVSFAAAALAACGCTQTADSEIKISGDKADYTITTGIDMNSFTFMAESLYGMSVDEFIQYMKDLGSEFEVGTIDDKEYAISRESGTGVPLATLQQMLQGNLPLEDVCITKDYFYGKYGAADTSVDDLMTSPRIQAIPLEPKMTDVTREELQKMKTNFYMNLTIEFGKAVTATNGTIDAENANKVTWVYKNTGKPQAFYAMTGKKSASAASVTGIKNGKIYKKNVTIKLKNAGNLYRMALNGSAIKANKVVKKEGVYTLSVWSKNGTCKTTTFTLDKKAPSIIGAANKKSYKGVVELTVTDWVSGIASFTVNGEEMPLDAPISGIVASGRYKIVQKGEYTVSVKDNAGNKKTITFTVK